MIIEKVIDMFFNAITFLVNKLPSGLIKVVSMPSIPLPLRYASCFFPMDLFAIIVGLFVTWYVIFMTWAVIEWVYKKIPGVS